jgi:ethanolamine ammonia-lyase small subunit
MSSTTDPTPIDRSRLRAYTTARVGLRRAGTSLATSELLDMALCLAEARDAVHAELSAVSLRAQFAERGLEAFSVRSAARDRAEYLRRPDLGRRLSPASRAMLEIPDPTQSQSRAQNRALNGPPKLAIIVADGLSAIAVERHAVPVLDALLSFLTIEDAESGEPTQSQNRALNGAPNPLPGSWLVGPVVIAEQARVAIGDEIGEVLKAAATLLLIGERPGLSSPDSLGAYITWAPRVGRSDAERNCISNIRPEGLSYPLAARKIAGYLAQARRFQLTGVALKEDSAQLEG